MSTASRDIVIDLLKRRASGAYSLADLVQGTGRVREELTAAINALDRARIIEVRFKSMSSNGWNLTDSVREALSVVGVLG